ncbi:hypothetical protein PUN4_330129 [Paraburkholderia unamae]|nr:hypothetical protein PUN4_330129 [Paraburkholderia unamae]
MPQARALITQSGSLSYPHSVSVTQLASFSLPHSVRQQA